jgi:hypothetical protein
MMRVCRDLQSRAPSPHAPACLRCSGSLRQRRMVSSAACGRGSTCPWTTSPGLALGRACSKTLLDATITTGVSRGGSEA